jgi:hypothetical protein
MLATLSRAQLMRTVLVALPVIAAGGAVAAESREAGFLGYTSRFWHLEVPIFPAGTGAFRVVIQVVTDG